MYTSEDSRFTGRLFGGAKLKGRFCLFLALGALLVCSASASTLVFTAIAVSNGSGGYYNTGSIPGGTAAGGIGINDSLEVVGSYNPVTTSYFSYVYNGSTLSFSSTGYQQALNSGSANTAYHGVNNSGTTIGVYTSQAASPTVAGGFIKTGSTDSTYSSVVNPTGTIDPHVAGEPTSNSNWNFFFNGISSSGSVAGIYTGPQGSGGTTHGFIYTGGTFQSSASETTYSAASNSSLYLCADSHTSTLGSSNNFESINSSGVVAGFCSVSGVKYGLTFNGSAYNLFQYSGAPASTELFAINNNGDIGGNYLTSTGTNEMFVCTASQVASAISAGVQASGAYLLSGCTTYDASSVGAFGLVDPLGGSINQIYLSGMNNLGDLVGVFNDSLGGTFSFIAAPPTVQGTVPEPGTMALFGVASGALLLLWKRRKA